MSTEDRNQRHTAENDPYGFLSDNGYPDEGPNPLIKPDPVGDAAARLTTLAASICASDACPVNHGAGAFCFRGWDAARTVARVIPPVETHP